MQKPFLRQLHPMTAPLAVPAGRRTLSPTATMPKRKKPIAEKLYHRAEGVLRENILGGRLPPGFVLLEAPIAGMLRTSRAPVQRALRMLEAEGLVHRFGGRGYLVGSDRGDAKPLRRDIRDFDLILPDAEGPAQRASWERIYAEIEMAVASCLIFGEFRIVEAAMAGHFSVSRTVVRDVLGRLHERGLIRKNRSSHWVAGPLTAQEIRERYELRRLLEPHALSAALPAIARSNLLAMRERLVAAERALPAMDPSTIEAMEEDLHTHCVLATPNEHLAEAIRQNRLPLMAMQRLLHALGVPSEPAVIVEHRLILELLLHKAQEAAKAALDAHLVASSRRAISRLKIVAVIPEPEVVAPYLTRAHL